MNKRIITNPDLTIQIMVEPTWRRDMSPVLYSMYSNRTTPKPVYIYMTEGGEVSGGCGDSVSGAMWDGVTFRYRINPAVSGCGLYNILTDEDVQSLLQTIHDDHVVEWSGSSCRGWLSKEAQEADVEVADLLMRLSKTPDYYADVRDPWEYYEYDTLAVLLQGETPKVAAERLASRANADDVYFANGVVTIREYLEARIKKENA